MINKNNYVNIQGWMLSDLNLKGTDLLVYAIIYGFCQVEGHCFHGSLKYLQEWTNCTKPCVIGALNNLVESGLLIKETSGFGQPNKYYVNKIYQYEDDMVNNLNHDGKENLPSNEETGKESLPNNIELNNNIDNNKYNAKVDEFNKIKEVLNYMNSVCGTTFKINSKLTQRSIKARFKEGFTIEDFKKVIDYKYKEWGLKPVMFSNGKLSDTYLRPATLFGNKFETYLYEANNEAKPINNKKVAEENFDFNGLEKF